MLDQTSSQIPLGSGRNEALPLSGSSEEARPFVTIVVPTLNEANYIDDVLASLITQWPAADCEILVVDGGSTDGTQSRVKVFAVQNPQVRLLHNPRRLQSSAVNFAARVASLRSTILVRADAHSLYPAGFLDRCVTAMLETGATSVVVPMINAALPGKAVQRAIAAAQSSALGNGGAAHRTGARSGFVDHGHHAVFDLRFFLSIGGYDESFTHNEDAEYDIRASHAAGRAWMCAEAPIIYFPRGKLSGLARQYFRHGRGRARTLIKHRMAPRPRQMAPVAALTGCVGAVALTPVLPTLSLLALVYPFACLTWGAAMAARHRDVWLMLVGPATILMHIAWGAGFLRMLGETVFDQGAAGLRRKDVSARDGI